MENTLTKNCFGKHIEPKEGVTMGIKVGGSYQALTVVDNDELMLFGVHYNGDVERCKRSFFRHIRRRVNRTLYRLYLTKEVFMKYNLIEQKDMDDKRYFLFHNGEARFENIAYLRKAGLNQKISLKEIIMVLYNAVSFRGHFLNEDIDFEHSDSLSVTELSKMFEEVFNLVEIQLKDPKMLNNIVNHFIENERFNRNEIAALDKAQLGVTQSDNEKLKEVIKLLSSQKTNITVIDKTSEFDVVKNIEELLEKDDELTTILKSLVDLSSLLAVAKFLKNKNFICEYYVEKCEQRKEIIEVSKTDEDKAKELIKIYFPSQYDDKIKKFNKIKAYRNNENKFPNGLVVKEIVAILKNQQKYYPDKITDEFIEEMKYILKMKIPFWVGPLDERATNAWLKKIGLFEHKTFQQMAKISIDEEETIFNFKHSLIGHCSYLRDQYVLAKSSWIGETFSILNMLNVLTAKKDGEDYVLTIEDKNEVLTKLFAKKEKVKYKDVKDLLKLDYFGTKDGNDKGSFNISYSVYRTLIKYVPQLEVKVPSEFNGQYKELVDRLEKILLNFNLFFEKQIRINYLIKEFPELDIKDVKRLSDIKTTGFFKFSKKLVSELAINKNGETMIEMMFRTNKEQMYIITNATDISGNPLNLDANPYYEYFEKHPHLNGNIFVDSEGKKRIPSMSDKAIRAISTVMKDIREFIKRYGYAPERIILQTTRDFGTIDDKDPQYKFAGNIEKKYNLVKRVFPKNKLASLSEVKQIHNELVKNLYVQQGGIDLFDGKAIDIKNLQNYECDHILPAGFGFDCFDNRMLTQRSYNQFKGETLPLQAIKSEMYENTSDFRDASGKQIEVKEFKDRVFALRNAGLISEKKLKFLLMEDFYDKEGYIGSSLVDTRYVSKEVTKVLKAFFEKIGCNTEIINLKYGLIYEFEKAFGISMNHNVGLQYRAMDSAMLIVADKCLRAYSPYYNKSESFGTYKRLINSLKNAKTYEKKNKNKYFLRKAYSEAFGHQWDDPNGLLETLKKTKPSFVMNRQKDPTGSWFDTNYKKDPSEKVKKLNDVIGITNKNTPGNSYRTGFKWYAADRYYVNGKPYVCEILSCMYRKKVLSNEAYANFVDNYRGYKELINEDGTIKKDCLYYRFYNGDYVKINDEYGYCYITFNSVINNKITIMKPDLFAYQDIENIKNKFRVLTEKKFNIMPAKNKRVEGVKYNEYKDVIKEVLDYIVDELIEVDENTISEKDINARKTFAKKEIIKKANIKIKEDEPKKGAKENEDKKENVIKVSCMYELAAYYQLKINEKYISNSFGNKNLASSYLNTCSRPVAKWFDNLLSL